MQRHASVFLFFYYLFFRTYFRECRNLESRKIEICILKKLKSQILRLFRLSFRIFQFVVFSFQNMNFDFLIFHISTFREMEIGVLEFEKKVFDNLDLRNWPVIFAWADLKILKTQVSDINGQLWIYAQAREVTHGCNQKWRFLSTLINGEQTGLQKWGCSLRVATLIRSKRLRPWCSVFNKSPRRRQFVCYLFLPFLHSSHCNFSSTLAVVGLLFC